MGIELGKCVVSAFPDGETFVKIEENVRGEDVFLIQSTSPPTNQHLMEMFIMMDALRRVSASRDHGGVAVLRSYARQYLGKDQPLAFPSRPSWWPICSLPPGLTAF